MTEELRVEDRTNVKKDFTNLSEKYSRYKRNIKKKEVSGKSLADVKKA